ncbi:7049_t:CDS:2, partial [Acaulospora colombiana]
KGFKEHKSNSKNCKGVNNVPQRPKVPKLDKSIKEFRNYKCMQPNPYRIFWDLECLTEKLTPEEEAQLTRTEKLQRHMPCSYCYVVVRMDSSLNYEVLSYYLYRGPDALEKFVDAIERELLEIQTDLSTPSEIIMEPGDYKAYNEAIECWICKKAFNKPASEISQQLEEAKHRLLECEEWEIYMKKEHPEMKDKLLADLHPTSSSASQRISENAKLWMSVNFDFWIYFTEKGYSLDKIRLLFQKGVFPYDWTNSWDKFDITRMFNDSLYKSSGVEIKLMTDMDEYLMVENGIRGGMTMVSHRYAKANNEKCPNYDPSKPKSWIMYEDMNALYSGAMTQYMPTEILGKVGPEEIPDIQSIAPDAEIGYMLEVDLEAPINMQDFFADYPLAPEKQIVPENWLSPYNEKLVHDKEVGGRKYTSGEKLLQTLLPKKNYVIHYYALQTYIKFGMKITKIYGALKFKQSSWMKNYIEENIRKRKIAKANKYGFGVMYHKLKSNAVFGKQMENIRKQMKVELLRSDQDKKLKRLTEDISKDRAERPDVFDLDYSGDLFLMKDESKGNPIGKSVCLKPKMYSVLPVGHDSKTPETDADFEKELEEEESRKPQECCSKKQNTAGGWCWVYYEDYIKRDFNEEWREIQLNSRKFRVSSLGKVQFPNGLISQGSLSAGYLRIAREKHCVHRLVALAFCPKEEGKKYVNHID